MSDGRTLKELDFEAKRRRYPNVPEHCLPRLKVKPGANGLTQSIVKFLNLKGHFASRTSSAGRYLVASKTWIPSTTKKGYPDITGIINGRSIHIEVKYGRDKMSPAQKAVQASIEAAGGFYFVARTFDEFEQWYYQTFDI